MGIHNCVSCKHDFDSDEQGFGKDELNNYYCQKCCADHPYFRGWGVFQEHEAEMHVRPINEPDHLHDVHCYCKPKVENENGVDIVIHNSFDGREAVEEALKILNQ